MLPGDDSSPVTSAANRSRLSVPKAYLVPYAKSIKTIVFPLTPVLYVAPTASIERPEHDKRLCFYLPHVSGTGCFSRKQCGSEQVLALRNCPKTGDFLHWRAVHEPHGQSLSLILLDVSKTESQDNVNNSTSRAFTGQIFVEKLSPHPAPDSPLPPIIFIAGAAQTGTNFLDTPDGRPGWASYFISKGHAVYLSDQPARGRSFWFPGQGSIGYIGSPDTVSNIFTDVSNNGNQWPQAKLHTQWPGTGRAEDPAFDSFYKSQMQFQTDRFLSEEQNAQAYSALVDFVGECYIISHSQAGAYGISNTKASYSDLVC